MRRKYQERLDRMSEDIEKLRQARDEAQMAIDLLQQNVKRLQLDREFYDDAISRRFNNIEKSVYPQFATDQALRVQMEDIWEFPLEVTYAHDAPRFEVVRPLSRRVVAMFPSGPTNHQGDNEGNVAAHAFKDQWNADHAAE